MIAKMTFSKVADKRPQHSLGQSVCSTRFRLGHSVNLSSACSGYSTTEVARRSHRDGPMF